MRILTLSTFLIIQICALSQITIETIDLPVGGEIYYRSTATTPNIDLNLTGANYTWDYTDLLRSTRDTFSYDGISSTPIFYQFQFNNPLDPDYKSTEALSVADIDLAGMLTMENNYLFSKKSNSEWSEVGIGTTVSGLPLPTKYTDIKTKLKLPLNFNDLNSDPYSYLISVPMFGSIGQDGVLSYNVDGWGSLQTPGGTYEVLRVKTELVKSDTVYIDPIGTGIRIPSNETVYEWYAKYEGYPILTVVEIAGTISSVVFSDDMTVGVDKVTNEEVINMYPNPVQNLLNIELTSAPSEITIMDNVGHIIYRSIERNTAKIEVGNLPIGTYFVQIRTENSVKVMAFIKQ